MATRWCLVPSSISSWRGWQQGWSQGGAWSVRGGKYDGDNTTVPSPGPSPLSPVPLGDRRVGARRSLGKWDGDNTPRRQPKKGSLAAPSSIPAGGTPKKDPWLLLAGYSHHSPAGDTPKKNPWLLPAPSRPSRRAQLFPAVPERLRPCNYRIPRQLRGLRLADFSFPGIFSRGRSPGRARPQRPEEEPGPAAPLGLIRLNYGPERLENVPVSRGWRREPSRALGEPLAPAVAPAG